MDLKSYVQGNAVYGALKGGGVSALVVVPMSMVEGTPFYQASALPIVATAVGASLVGGIIGGGKYVYDSCTNATLLIYKK